MASSSKVPVVQTGGWKTHPGRQNAIHALPDVVLGCLAGTTRKVPEWVSLDFIEVDWHRCWSVSVVAASVVLAFSELSQK
jgi:hypothetical protein